MANINAIDSLVSSRPTASHPIRCRLKASDSFRRLDVSRLDDRPPLLDLGLVKSGQRLRRLFLARRDHVTEFREPLPHGWIGQRLDDGAIEPVNDLLGRAFGSPQT